MTNRFAAAGALALVIFGSGAPAFAQDAIVPVAAQDAAVAPATTEERLTLRAGDVFEMVADPGVADATYSWILTQERTFIEAGRERLFRYRFVQEQSYTLRAEAVLPTGERRQRTFMIDILAQGDTSISPVYPAGTGASLAGTVPAPDTNGRVVLTPAQHVLQLTPMRTDVSPLALDLDAARDTDGDGNPENDVDDTGTYFHSFGRSLWIWFARPLTQTDLIITAVPPGSSPLVQRISVLSQEVASTQGVLTSAVIVRSEQIDDSTFGFTAEFPRPIPGDSPLLYEWEFGDGLRSLETSPVHTYATDGDHVVKLHVRDLGTGETVGRSETTVSAVVPVDEPVDEPDPTPVDEPDPTPVEEPSDGEGLPWGRILLIVGIFIGSLAVGIAIVWLLSFLRKSRSLEQTLESMEKVVAPTADQAPPLAIKSKPQGPPPQAQQKVIDAELNAASPAPVSTQVSEAAAPSWLKKGLAADQSAAKTPAPAPTAAKPAPVPKSSAPPAEPPRQAAPSAPAASAAAAPAVPKAVPTTVPKSPAPAAPAPAQKPQPAAAPAAAPAAKPAPAAQAPAPVPSPAQPKSVAPATIASVPSVDDPPVVEAPDPAKLPRWLQPSTPAPAAPTAPSPATAPAPKPAPAPVVPSTQVAAPINPAAPKPQAPVAPPRPAPAAPSASVAQPKPAPAPTATAPTPKPVSAPVIPSVPKPQPAQVPAPASRPPTFTQPKPVTPVATQNPQPTPVVPAASAPVTPTPAPVPTAPRVPAAQPAPATPVSPTPVPTAPAAGASPIATPPMPTQQATPPPALPSAPKNDDDRPIAIIRADSLDPEQPK